MWRYFLLIACLCHEALAEVTIEMPDLTASYTISNEMQCQNADHPFTFYFHISLNDCVVKCALRGHCAGLQYNQPMSLCMLFTDGGENATATGSTGRCVYVKRENIKIKQTICNVPCTSRAVCDIATHECKIQDCPSPPTLTNGKVFGNRRGVGDSIRFVCNIGYKNARGIKQASCVEGGTWSETAECVLDPGEEISTTTSPGDQTTTPTELQFSTPTQTLSNPATAISSSMTSFYESSVTASVPVTSSVTLASSLRFNSITTDLLTEILPTSSIKTESTVTEYVPGTSPQSSLMSLSPTTISRTNIVGVDSTVMETVPGTSLQTLWTSFSSTTSSWTHSTNAESTGEEMLSATSLGGQTTALTELQFPAPTQTLSKPATAISLSMISSPESSVTASVPVTSSVTLATSLRSNTITTELLAEILPTSSIPFSMNMTSLTDLINTETTVTEYVPGTSPHLSLTSLSPTTTSWTNRVGVDSTVTKNAPGTSLQTLWTSFSSTTSSWTHSINTESTGEKMLSATIPGGQTTDLTELPFSTPAQTLSNSAPVILSIMTSLSESSVTASVPVTSSAILETSLLSSSITTELLTEILPTSSVSPTTTPWTNTIGVESTAKENVQGTSPQTMWTSFSSTTSSWTHSINTQSTATEYVQESSPLTSMTISSTSTLWTDSAVTEHSSTVTSTTRISKEVGRY